MTGDRGEQLSGAPVIAAFASGQRSVAVGGSVPGIVSTGDNALNVVVQAEQMILLPAGEYTNAAEVEAPHRLCNVPVRPGQFVGRVQALACLDEAIATSGEVVVQAVHGLGGIGKSTLVAHWALTHAAERNPIWWIAADSPASIESGLVAMAVALRPQLSALPPSIAAEWAAQWLSTHTDWLVILDNVNDPADVAPLLARADRGRFVITSRRATGWHALAAPLRLDVFEHDEAVGLLTGIITHASPRQPEDLDGADELCTELGHLPLAIEQAGAYLAETGTTPRAYLRLLERYPAAMFRHAATDTDSEHTIARIWRITLDRLAGEPMVGDLLRILAWCAPEPVPREILYVLLEPVYLDHLIGRLAAYSMIAIDPHAGTLLVHRLVQAVTRTPDRDDPHRDPTAIGEARDRATQVLNCALAGDYDDPAAWDTWRLISRHAQVLIAHTPPEADTEHTARLLNQIALFREEHGDLAGAADYLERACASIRRIAGDDDPGTAAARNNLASVYTYLGKISDAISFGERAVADRRRTLGEDAPDTLASCQILANAYRQAGDLARAVPLYEQTLAARRRILGDEHRDTLESRNRLAGALRDAGDLTRAIPLYEQALTSSRTLLGDRHPLSLSLRSNLASAYKDAGRLGEAIAMFEQSLVDARDVLGKNHPQTLAVCNNLAGAYQNAGASQRAVALFQQTLDDSRTALGEDNPDTLSVRHNLAAALLNAGQLQQALRLFEDVMADRLRVLGDDHPDTLVTHNSLAFAVLATGEPYRAIALFQRAQAECRRVLGEGHPQTLTAGNNLALAYRSVGDSENAIAQIEQTVAECRRALGDDHLDTLQSSANLAAMYMSAQRRADAIAVLEQTLAISRQGLGDDHPMTRMLETSLHAANVQP